MGAGAATYSVRIGADITQLREGLAEAQTAVMRSAEAMGTTLTTTAATADGGTSAAREFLRGLTAEFNTANTQLRAALFQGELTPDAFRAQGQTLAQQFNTGITTGLQQFAAQGMLTPAMEAQMVNRYKSAGLEAGTAFSATATPAIQQAATGFARFGESGALAMTRVATGVSMLALSVGSTENAVVRMGGALSSIAMMIPGQWAMVISAVIAVGTTIVRMFTQAGKAADEAAAAAQRAADATSRAITDMANAGDKAGIKRRMQTLWQGTPDNEFTDAIPALKKRLADQQRKLAAFARSNETSGEYSIGELGTAALGGDYSGMTKVNAARIGFLQLTADVDKTKQALAAALAEWNKLENAFRKPLPRQSSAPSPITITAARGGAGASNRAAGGAGSIAGDPVSDMTAEMQALLALQRNVAAGGAPLAGLNERIVASLAKLEGALAGVADQYGAVAVKLREYVMAGQSASSTILSSIVGITPSATDPLAPGKMAPVKSPFGDGPIKDVASATRVLPGKLDQLGAIFGNAIKSQTAFLAQSLAMSVLGGRGRGVGGSIGGALGGALGAGVASIAGGFFGSGFGAAVGSTIFPVVGTVVGALAGAAIGKLFGGGTKRATETATSALDAMSRAAQRVSESLQNVPDVFKVALLRFQIGDPRAIPAGATLPGGYGAASGSVTFNGPVTVVTQAASADEMYRQITARARSDSRRGGATSLQIAMAGA